MCFISRIIAIYPSHVKIKIDRIILPFALLTTLLQYVLGIIMGQDAANKNRILLVEDDRFIRDIYHELLTEAGFTVEMAVDGEEGLTKVSEGGYDLVLLDIMLPKRDGLDILKTLKEKPPANPNRQIVLLTNLGQEAIMREGFVNGASGYLIKSSLTPDQILAEVQSYLNK